MRIRIDGFVGAMLLTVTLAIVAPRLGARDGPLHLGIVIKLAIGLMFFVHGAALSPQAPKADAAAWRLHPLVHASTVVLFPVLGAALFWGARRLPAPEVQLGVCYPSAPSLAIAASFAMTALGRGNVPGAIVDAAPSGLTGMILTPLTLYRQAQLIGRSILARRYSRVAPVLDGAAR